MLIIIVSLVLLLSLSSCFKIDSTTSEVKISSNDYELKVNEELKLPIQINDLDVTYVSSNDDIVSINGNTITALKSGSTVIYAMNNNKSIKEPLRFDASSLISIIIWYRNLIPTAIRHH